MVQMVEELGPAGMSSDESEVDEKTEKNNLQNKEANLVSQGV